MLDFLLEFVLTFFQAVINSFDWFETTIVNGIFILVGKKRLFNSFVSLFVTAGIMVFPQGFTIEE